MAGTIGAPGGHAPPVIPPSTFTQLFDLMAVVASPDAVRQRMDDLRVGQQAFTRAREDANQAEAVARDAVKEAGRLMAEADAHLEQVNAKVAQAEIRLHDTNAEVERKLGKLTDERRKFRDETAAANHELDDKRSSLRAGQAQLEMGVEANKQRSNALDDRERNVEAREREAERVIAEYNGKTNKLREIAR
jgi:predicted  nucleic acid-binding Zn-ribbon protein